MRKIIIFVDFSFENQRDGERVVTSLMGNLLNPHIMMTTLQNSQLTNLFNQTVNNNIESAEREVLSNFLKKNLNR
jgi:hypothetical protein